MIAHVLFAFAIFSAAGCSDGVGDSIMQNPAIGMTWTITGYTPQMIWIVDDSVVGMPGGFVGSYVPGVGVVLGKRGTYNATTKSYAIIDYFQYLKINVKGGSAFYSQWQKFAEQVFNYLIIYEKVRFRGPITTS